MLERKLKIALISPKGPLYRHRGGIWKKSLRYQPLTLTTLAALIPSDLNADGQLVDEGIVEVPLDLDADLVGLTVITGTAIRAYHLGDLFRRRGIAVVLGGPHVTLIPDDAAPHADAVVTGYAEDSWPELLRDFTLGRVKPRYDQAPGLDLADRPFARRELLPGHRYLTNNVFEATRGCIHNCDFCVVPTAWGRKPLQKPVTDVVADIRQHGARKLIFVDLNIIADHLKLLELAARSGCKGLLMGLESISPQNLRQNHKGFHAPEKFVRVVERLHEHGIALQGCFVFGLDHDGPDVFLKTAEFAIQARIDLPRFAIVTPFPNTALYKRLEAERRILTRNWELYDGQHVVFRPAKLTIQELQQGAETAWKHAYSFRSIARRISP